MAAKRLMARVNTNRSLHQRKAEADRDLKEMISRIMSTSDGLKEKSEMDYTERFGDVIASVRDGVAEDNAANRRSLSRGLAVGGDFTGTGSVIANTLAQSGNEAVSRVESDFAIQNEGINQNYLGQAMKMEGMALGAKTDQFGFASADLTAFQDRRAMENQAKKNRRAAILGTVLGGATNFIKPGV